MKILKHTLGNNHTYLASTYNNLALLYLETKEYDKAFQYLE